MENKKFKPLIEIKKIELSKQQRMLILLHESASSQQNNLNKHKTPMDTKDQIENKQKEYFDNFPFDEKAVRDFLSCKKEQGYFKDYDVMTDKLSDMLSFPEHRYGFRIINVTVGKGTHNTMIYGGHELLDVNYQVNENEVYVTYNTQQMMSGGKFTAVMKRENGKNEIIKGYTHSRS